MPGAMIRDKQLPTPPPEGSKYPGLGIGNESRAKHMKGSSSGSISKRLASGSSQSSNGAKRTAYGSGSADNMNKGVDVSDDLLIRLLAQRALSDTAESHILNPEEIEDLKNEQSLLKSMIESTGRKLMLEQKVKQAAQSLYRLENAASKRQRSNSSVNANSHLDTAQKKCDEISAELWRLQSLEMDIERRLMNHNAAVLGLGMNIMERKAMEGRMNDDFGEGHLYIGQDHEDDESPMRRFSISGGSRSRSSISGNSTQTAYGISTIPSAEVTEAQTRLRQLNFHIATIARTDISPASDNLISYIDQLEQNFQSLNTAHTTVTRDLQTSLSESQRVIETLKLRERDQSTAITENTSRIEDLERRLLHTQKEFDRVQNELDDQDALVDTLKQDLDTAREEARIAESAALGREAESLRREKSLRRGETERYTNDLAQRDRSIADLSSQLGNIQQQHGYQSQLSRDLQSQLDTQAQQHDLAIRDLETQLVMLKSETAMLKAEKDEILGSRQQRAEEARKQRELDEQREKYRSVADDSLAQELEVLKKRNSQLTRDLQYSESERQSTEQTLSRQIELLEKQVSDHADTVVVAVNRGDGQAATDRERMLEERCKELQDELSSILDDFERLTSQFIDHEAFRQNLELQVDALRGQCHNLQTELAEEKVRHLGRDVTSPVQGGFSTEQTSTGTLRTEFRKMVAELRNEHVTALKVEYDERRKLEGVIRELKKEKDRERYTAGRNGEK